MKTFLAFILVANIGFALDAVNLPNGSTIRLPAQATQLANRFFTELPAVPLDKASPAGTDMDCSQYSTCVPFLHCSLMHKSLTTPQVIPPSKEFIVAGVELRKTSTAEKNTIYHPWYNQFGSLFIVGKDLLEIFVETKGGSRLAIECLVVEHGKNVNPTTGVRTWLTNRDGVKLLTVDELRKIFHVEEAPTVELP